MKIRVMFINRLCIYTWLLTAKTSKEIIMKEITKINHVGIRVRDLDVSHDFYKKLGFKFLAGPVGPEPVAVVEHPSGVNINFILNASEEAPLNNILMQKEMKYPGYTHMALEITSAESVSRQLEDLGIAITERVEYEGAQFFFVRDPDDNVIEFHQPAGS
jgi:lactoylglutathione lyase